MPIIFDEVFSAMRVTLTASEEVVRRNEIHVAGGVISRDFDFITVQNKLIDWGVKSICRVFVSIGKLVNPASCKIMFCMVFSV
jgi:hypothetical protein